jgi:gamma-glutamylcyclotransferase (GGCT)/AIG2-like uncharacterized protein YtfP
MRSERLFVYGTLRPPREGRARSDSRFYPAVAPYVLASEPARLPDAVLYDMGPYPAARPGEGTVLGELLTVRAGGLRVADRIEGHPHLFRRERVVVRRGAESLEAWVYWAPVDMVEGRRPIPSGDWFART